MQRFGQPPRLWLKNKLFSKHLYTQRGRKCNGMIKYLGNDWSPLFTLHVYALCLRQKHLGYNDVTTHKGEMMFIHKIHIVENLKNYKCYLYYFILLFNVTFKSINIKHNENHSNVNDI